MAKNCRSINFPGAQNLPGPQNGGKMTGMDILEFIDINGPAPMPKYGTILPFDCWGGGTLPVNNSLLTGTVPVNNSLFTGTYQTC